MNRFEEYEKLKIELSETPEELENTLNRANEKMKKHRKRFKIVRFLTVIATSMASLFIGFIIMVNVFPQVAYAVSDIDFLKPLILAVSNDESLKKAVEHDYIQYIGKSLEKDGMKLEVKYILLDSSRMSIFFTINTEEFQYDSGNFSLLNEEGEELEKVLMSYNISTKELNQLDAYGDMDSTFPERMTIELKINNTEFKIPIVLDKRLLNIREEISIDKDLNLGTEKVKIDKAIIYPLQTIVSIKVNGFNIYDITELDMKFVNENGMEYKIKSSGVKGIGGDGKDFRQLYESLYFEGAKSLILRIEGYERRKIDTREGKIDYKNQTISNMPENISVKTMDLQGNRLYVTLKVEDDGVANGSLVESTYQSNGETLDVGETRITTNDQEKFYEYSFTLKKFSKDNCSITWNYSEYIPLPEPIDIKIK